jgi:hypothetical protein
MRSLLLLCMVLFVGVFDAKSQSYDQQLFQLLTTNPEAFRAYLVNNPGVVVNLKGAPLNGVDMSRMELENVNLSYAKLEGANFKESNLNRANFIGANIKNANFSRTTLEQADFSKANATGANFSEATFKETELTYLLIQMDNQLYPAIITDQGAVVPASK